MLFITVLNADLLFITVLNADFLSMQNAWYEEIRSTEFAFNTKLGSIKIIKLFPELFPYSSHSVESFSKSIGSVSDSESELKMKTGACLEVSAAI